MDKIIGQAGNLNDLVAYQKGSVVSKEIIKKDGYRGQVPEGQVST